MRRCITLRQMDDLLMLDSRPHVIFAGYGVEDEFVRANCREWSMGNPVQIG